jgi:hypothetical protein
MSSLLLVPPDPSMYKLSSTACSSKTSSEPSCKEDGLDAFWQVLVEKMHSKVIGMKSAVIVSTSTCSRSPMLYYYYSN